MATIDLSAIADDMRGKIGNVIIQRWKDILYVRKFTMPRESNTEVQKKQRACLSMLLPLWRSLDIMEKRTWNDAARDLPMSGYNLCAPRNTRICGKQIRVLSSKCAQRVVEKNGFFEALCS